MNSFFTFLIKNTPVIIFIIFSSGASFLSGSVNFWYLLVIFYLFLFSVNRLRVDLSFIFLVVFWTLINLLANFANIGNITLFGLLGSLVYFLYPYLFLKVHGAKIIFRLEKFIYILTLISLVIFILDISFSMVFDRFHPYFKFFTNKVFYEAKDSQGYYWYSFFYTHSGRNDFRNSGFMWEPGGYSFALVIGILLNWILYGLSLNKRVLIYIIGILSSFSSSGYLSLIFILLLLLLNFNKARLSNFGILVVLVLFLFYNFDFASEKLNLFLEESQDLQGYDSVFQENKIEVNRLLSFIINFKQSLLFPFGYGAVEVIESNEYNYFATINGLGDILVKWGFLGFMFFIYMLRKFLILCMPNLKSSYLIIFGYLTVLPILFSNPILNNPFFWLIIFIPVVLIVRI